MTPTYWVEITLNIVGDRAMVDDLVDALDRLHEGQIAYTFSQADSQLTLGMSTVCDEAIELVVPRVVGTVRTAAHELGYHTPGWPEPVSIGDVSIKALASAPAHC